MPVRVIGGLCKEEQRDRSRAIFKNNKKYNKTKNTKKHKNIFKIVFFFERTKKRKKTKMKEYEKIFKNRVFCYFCFCLGRERFFE